MVRFGVFPMGLGNRLIFNIHKPLKVSDYSFEELFEKTEYNIVKGIKI
jgi:1-acyl-sn-glycerol-3-phosphate acyltransferase